MTKFIRFRTQFCSYSGQLLFTVGILTLISACNSDPQRRPSPLRLDSGMVKDVKVKIEYSSPGVKGREIFGDGSDYLVEYQQLWRTGANDASFITLNKPLMISSVLFDSGSYSIFTIPSPNYWTVIFNKEWQQWGSYNYTDTLDMLRMTVPVNKLDSLQERMQFLIEDDSLKFKWENVGWSIKLTTPS